MGLQKQFLLPCRLILFLMCFLIRPCLGQDVTTFVKDSTTIVKNSNVLLGNSKAPKDKDSLFEIITKGVLHSNSATTDLGNYYLARHFFMRRNIEQANAIIEQNLHDTFNPHFSDAKFYNMKGVIFSLQKKYDYAISSFIKASSSYEKQGNNQRAHLIYNNIANIYLALGDYNQAYRYSAESFSAFRNKKDSPYYLSLLGVLSVCENNLNMLDSSDIHTKLGISMANSSKDIKGVILINYARSELLHKKKAYYKSIPFARKSLALSNKFNLTQYEIMASILLMNSHNALKEYQLAKEFGLSAEKKMSSTLNLSLKHAITKGLATASYGAGDYKRAYQYLSVTDSLKTKDRNKENKKVMDSLMVKFETLKKENRILRQETLIAQKNQKIERSKMRLIIEGLIISLVIIAIIVIVIFYRQKLKLTKQRQKVLLEKAISESGEVIRDSIASQLHDSLAAELTALRLELEQNNSTSNQAFEMLHRAHEMTRDVSHNLSPFIINERGLAEAIRYIVGNFSSTTAITYFTNVKERISMKSEYEIIIFRSTQELIQNAIKHANAKQIDIQLIHKGSEISINIEDDGIGLSKDVIKNSIGLGSLVQRIELVGASITFDAVNGKGTSIFINAKIDG